MPHAVYKLPHWFDEGFEERRAKAVDEPTSRFASSGSFADLLRTTITNALGFRKHGLKEERRSPATANRTLEVRIREDQTRHVPVKVELKTFFANERTLLQWLSMAILLLFLGLGLMTKHRVFRLRWTLNVSSANVFGGGHSHASAVCGVIIAPIAVVFMIYALWTFIVRAKRIARREPKARGTTTLVPGCFSRHSLRRRHGEHHALRRERRLEPSRVRASDEILKIESKSPSPFAATSTTPSDRRISDRSRRLFEKDAGRRRVIFPTRVLHPKGRRPRRSAASNTNRTVPRDKTHPSARSHRKPRRQRAPSRRPPRSFQSVRSSIRS